MKRLASSRRAALKTVPFVNIDICFPPVLFQFPKSFRADFPVLEAFLDLIPGDLPCAFEFRNPSRIDDKMRDILHKRGCSLCIADTDENPANMIISTTSWGYLRLRRSDYSDKDLSQWMERIVAQKWESAFVFFKHEEEAKGPETAMRFRVLIEPGVKKKRLAS